MESKLFVIRDDDGGLVAEALVPFGDMIPRKNPESVEYRWGSHGGQDGVVFSASKDIAQGEQVTTARGPRTNFQLLSTYGVVEPVNVNKQPVFLRHFGVLPDDPLA